MRRTVSGRKPDTGNSSTTRHTPTLEAASSEATEEEVAPEGADHKEGGNCKRPARGQGGARVVAFSFFVFIAYTYAWAGYIWGRVGAEREEEKTREGEGSERERKINRESDGRESPRGRGVAPARWPWLVSRCNTPNSRFLLFRHKWR